MKTQTHKPDILKVRMDASTLQLLEQARAYAELDKSKFIRLCIREKAEQIIAEHETTRFNADDWQMFFELLDNPSAPTQRMRKAAETYRNITESDAV